MVMNGPGQVRPGTVIQSYASVSVKDARCRDGGNVFRFPGRLSGLWEGFRTNPDVRKGNDPVNILLEFPPRYSQKSALTGSHYLTPKSSLNELN